MLDRFSEAGSFVLGFAAAGVLIALTYGLPRLIRSGQRWGSAVLFSSLTGWRGLFANIVSMVTVFWMFVLAGALYSPVAAFAPETLPAGGGVGRAVFIVDFWLLLMVVPLLEGGIAAVLTGYRGRQVVQRLPAGFVHLLALGAALTLLAPWLIGRRGFLLLSRRQQETYSASIDLASYEQVVEAIAKAAGDTGLDVSIRSGPFLVRTPRLLVDTYGPPPLRSPRPYRILRIEGDDAELTIFATLIDVVAKKKNMGRLRSALLDRLPPAGMWWTQSPEAREIEGAIRTSAAPEALLAAARRLALAQLGAEEWRVLQREYLIAVRERI